MSGVGFWPGDAANPAAFYSYAYPEPPGFAGARVQPSAAYYSDQLHEFVLPYDAVRNSQSPDDAILAFAQSAYERAATLAGWGREAREEVHLHAPAPIE